MENHPIPQDITGFQFKLFGELTVKQFAYVASGVISAWIFFVLPLPTLVKLPVSIFLGAIGAALAFLPVQGRPLDLMIVNFFRAVFRPTQYVYQRHNEAIPQSQAQSAANIKALYDAQFKDFIKKFPKKGDKLEKKESVFFQNIYYNVQNPEPVSVPTAAPAHMYADKNTPMPQMEAAPVQPQKPVQAPTSANSDEYKKTAEALMKELDRVKKQEAAQEKIDPKTYLETHQKVLDLQKQVSDMLLQKQQLESRLVELQKSNQQSNNPVYKASQAQAPQESKNVRMVSQSSAKSVGLPITPEFPNVVTGIVKDPRNNPLPNILVEVKDDQGNAVRAFKTNALGHFASATALINGNYTIDFEDSSGNNKFDSIGFEANGQIINPIEVISVDGREELRRSLFN